MKLIIPAYVECQNLNIRMGNRCMTRLTDAFSKKAASHNHMMAIYFMHYNFVRIHKTLKTTPAMAAGVTPKLWEMADMVKVLEDWEVARQGRGALCLGRKSNPARTVEISVIEWASSAARLERYVELSVLPVFADNLSRAICLQRLQIDSE